MTDVTTAEETAVIEHALELVEEINQLVSRGNPHLVLKFQELADMLETAGWVMTDAISNRDSLLEENETLATDLAETSGDYTQLLNDLISWQESDNIAVVALVELVRESLHLQNYIQQMESKDEQRAGWIDAAAVALGGDRLVASALADFLFDGAPSFPETMRHLVESLLVNVE